MGQAFLIKSNAGSAFGKLEPKYSFSGNSELVVDENGNYLIYFYDSGNLSFSSLPLEMAADVFLVGAGGGGAGSRSGGGGGYTSTTRNVSLQLNTAYTIVIGEGVSGGAGGDTTFSILNLKAGGGNPGTSSGGGNGGSGGGPYYNRANPSNTNSSNLANGASDGYDAGKPAAQGTPGKGQRSTPGPNGETGNTRLFGENDAQLYAGGGAGVYVNTSAKYKDAYGGEGGGGSYTGNSGDANNSGPGNGGHDGEPNTGGGGSGGANKTAGGSGIAVIRFRPK